MHGQWSRRRHGGGRPGKRQHFVGGADDGIVAGEEMVSVEGGEDEQCEVDEGGEDGEGEHEAVGGAALHLLGVLRRC